MLTKYKCLEELDVLGKSQKVLRHSKEQNHIQKMRGKNMNTGTKRMNRDELRQFVEKIGRSELYDEIEDYKKMRKAPLLINHGFISRYLKAVRVTLVTLGYDEQWVDTECRDALEDRYLDSVFD